MYNCKVPELHIHDPQVLLLNFVFLPAIELSGKYSTIWKHKCLLSKIPGPAAMASMSTTLRRPSIIGHMPSFRKSVSFTKTLVGSTTSTRYGDPWSGLLLNSMFTGINGGLNRFSICSIIPLYRPTEVGLKEISVVPSGRLLVEWRTLSLVGPRTSTYYWIDSLTLTIKFIIKVHKIRTMSPPVCLFGSKIIEACWPFSTAYSIAEP